MRRGGGSWRDGPMCEPPPRCGGDYAAFTRPWNGKLETASENTSFRSKGRQPRAAGPFAALGYFFGQ